MRWTQWKFSKTHSNPGSRVPQDLQDLGHFSRNFGLVKGRIEPDVKGGYKRHNLQQKQMMYLPYFGQDLESKKNVVGILAHVCYWPTCNLVLNLARRIPNGRRCWVANRESCNFVSHSRFRSKAIFLTRTPPAYSPLASLWARDLAN